MRHAQLFIQDRVGSPNNNLFIGYSYLVGTLIYTSMLICDYDQLHTTLINTLLIYSNRLEQASDSMWPRSNRNRN